ncbi:MAG: TlpA family protein disulfide reductase [Thermoanaerobaculia bacterium]
MLAQSVVNDFKGKVRFVSENYGNSALARRFGVTFYPVIFVDDVLVATPKDFFNMDPKASGRYIPFKTAGSHERFRADLSRMIGLILAGKKESARAQADPGRMETAATLPAMTLTDLDGRTISRNDLAGRVVLVEMWATWCPPCRGTLGWLGGLKRKYGNRIAVLALAVQSEEAAVRKIAGEMKLPLTWAMGTPERVGVFGDVSAVPTLFLFGPDGESAGAFYGAPPDLHETAESKIATLIERSPAE